MRSAKRNFVRTISRRSATVFLLGVFLLFSTIGLTMDMIQMGRQPLSRLVLTLLVISTFAVLYAVMGFTLRRKSWLMAFVPIFIAEWFIMAALNSWIVSLAPLNLANAGSVMRLHNRLNLDAVAIIVTMCLGYSCFVYASVREGRR